MIQFLSHPSLAWWLLVLATAGETLWFIILKKWGGFEFWPWNLSQYLLIFINVSLLSFVLKTLPTGTVYAFWTGASAVAIAILGIDLLLFNFAWYPYRVPVKVPSRLYAHQH